jgi:saccharopine dehydrogenase-like NADP-dependent oxidoreductase
MKVFCLGGAGRICREAALDLVQFTQFERITIADYDETAGLEAVGWLNDPRVEFVSVDVTDEDATIAQKACHYDIVMDGTTISLNDISTRCIANAGLPRHQPQRFRRGVQVRRDSSARTARSTCLASA